MAKLPTNRRARMAKLCRHCMRGTANRSRGLCFRCYYAPGVRELYPITSKFCSKGYGIDHNRTRLSSTPTHYLPGTPEKLEVLEKRCSEGVCLFHPDDALCDGICDMRDDLTPELTGFHKVS